MLDRDVSLYSIKYISASQGFKVTSWTNLRSTVFKTMKMSLYKPMHINYSIHI